MKLYYSRGACSLGVRIIIHELNLSVDFEAVDLKTKKTETGKDFLTINPKGAVPTLVTDNEVLTENAAILQFLAESQKAQTLLPPTGHFTRYRVLEWLSFVSSDVHKSFGPLFNADVPADLKTSIFIPLLKKRLNFVEKSLEQKDFLAGDTFTLPDAYFFVMLFWLHHFKIDVAEWPNLSHYFQTLKNRKAIQQALKEEGFEKVMG
ncbi:MAG: glutathione transferase GstA [Gammaproteobacteria bacterium]|nr:glutathione transferase GstA [Gammaproteobacteria bacterium]